MMTLNSISVIAAIMAVKKEKKVSKEEKISNNSNPLFFLCCKKEEKMFSFYPLKNEDNNFSLYRLSEGNIVTGNRKGFYDFADNFSYHIIESLTESWNWQVINLTLGDVFGVRYKDGCYRVVDYQIQEFYDFEYLNFASAPNTIHQDDTKESPIPSNEY